MASSGVIDHTRPCREYRLFPDSTVSKTSLFFSMAKRSTRTIKRVILFSLVSITPRQALKWRITCPSRAKAK